MFQNSSKFYFIYLFQIDDQADTAQGEEKD